MSKKIRFGIIGCSRIAELSTIPAILNSNHAELTLIGSRTQEKAQNFATKFNCKNYGSYTDVLEDSNVDAVYISLPVGLHEEWTIKAAKAGKHVLCEKSSTISFESAKRMVDAAKQTNVRLMEGFMFRFHPSHKKVLEIIHNQHLGNLFSFYGMYGFPAVSKTDIRYKKELGGGILNDAACYPICASRMIFEKEPTATYCNLQFDKETDIDIRASIFLSYGSAQFAQMIVGYDLYYQSMYSIWGNEGFLRLSRSYNIPHDMSASLTINSNKQNEEISIAPTNHFMLMIDGFCSELYHNQTSLFNFEEDLLNQAKVMEAARLSSSEERVVEIAEIN